MSAASFDMKNYTPHRYLDDKLCCVYSGVDLPSNLDYVPLDSTLHRWPIDWPAAVHILLTRQAFLTLKARFSNHLEWPLVGGDADRFNLFLTSERGSSVEVFYHVRMWDA